MLLEPLALLDRPDLPVPQDLRAQRLRPLLLLRQHLRLRRRRRPTRKLVSRNSLPSTREAVSMCRRPNRRKSYPQIIHIVGMEIDNLVVKVGIYFLRVVIVVGCGPAGEAGDFLYRSHPNRYVSPVQRPNFLTTSSPFLGEVSRRLLPELHSALGASQLGQCRRGPVPADRNGEGECDAEQDDYSSNC